MIKIERFNNFIAESVSLQEYKSIIFEVLSDLGYRKRTTYMTVESKEFGNHVSLFLNREHLITTWKLERLTDRGRTLLKNKIEELISTNPQKYRI